MTAAATASATLPLQSGGFLWYALLFALLAILATVAGFRGIAGVSMRLAKLLTLVFVALFVLTLLP